MTRYERLNFIMTGLAILISIVSAPLVTYFFIDPKLQEIRNKKLLIVDEYISIDKDRVIYRIEMENPGKTPASDVKIVMSDSDFDVQYILPKISISPPSPYDIETRERVSTLFLKRVLGPKEKITFSISEIIGSSKYIRGRSSISAYSEIGIAIHRNHAPWLATGGGGKMGGGGAER